MLELLKDLFRFAKKRKKYVIFPVILLLILLGTLLFLVEGSILAPFIYTLF